MLGRFVGAAVDGCGSCQDAQLKLMVEDPATTARLVELACVSTYSLMGGLPVEMIDLDAPGVASSEFRRLARVGLGGANTVMWTECEAMDTTQRRAALETAADILIGQLSVAARPGAAGDAVDGGAADAVLTVQLNCGAT
ncbi:hypothetical protein [Nocardia sp. NPDC004860]|uniref:hypothetical protein n=1 Tax=Nocardia sp. NPDC004860 TaxID=3154557 RepID=UPI0033B4C6C9